MKRQGVVYARVSSKEQAEGFSIPAQVKLLRDYAARNSIEVVESFTEAETARKAGRTAFRRMLDYLEEHPGVRVILVEKTDRLHRNLQDYAKLDVDDSDLEIHLVKEGEVLSRNSRSQQKFMHGIKVLMAKNYCDNLSEEVIKGMTEKATQGLWPSAAPIGYRNTAEHTIEPDPEEAPLVRRAFDLAASGRETYAGLSRKLHAEGLRSRRAKRALGKEALRRILTNPIYYGDFEWNGVLYQGSHEPLVTRELFERVQDAVARKSWRRKRQNDFAFTGLITCGSCGGAVTADAKKGGRYVYYHCAAKCDAVEYIREREVSEQLGAPLRRIQLTPEIVEWTRAALLESHVEQAAEHTAAVERLHLRRTKLASYADQAYQDRLEGRISIEMWTRKTAEWEKEAAEIDRELVMRASANRSYIAEGVQLIELAQAAHSLYVSQPPREQRRLLDLVLSNCRLVGRTIEYDLRKPFDLMLDVTEMEKWRGGRDSNSRPPA